MAASPKDESISAGEFYKGIANEADAIAHLKSAKEKQEAVEKLDTEMEAFEKANLTAEEQIEKQTAIAKVNKQRMLAQLRLKQEERELEEMKAAEAASAVSATMVNESKPELKPKSELELELEETDTAEKDKKELKETKLDRKEESGNTVLNRVDKDGNIVSSASFAKDENGRITVNIKASTDEGRLQSMKDGLEEMSKMDPHCSVGFKNFSDEHTYEGMKEAMRLEMTPRLEGKGLMDSAELFLEQAQKNPEDSAKAHESTKDYLEKVAGNEQLKGELIKEMEAKGLGSEADLKKLEPKELAEKAVDKVVSDVEAKKNGPTLASSSEAKPEPAAKEDKVEEVKKDATDTVETAAASKDKPASPSPSSLLSSTAKKEEAKDTVLKEIESAKISASTVDTGSSIRPTYP